MKYVKYLGGICITNSWTKYENLIFTDIVSKCMKLCYSKVTKIIYYKPRGDWEFQSLVKNDVEVKQIWLKGTEFEFLKLFIECKPTTANSEKGDKLLCEKHYGYSSRRCLNKNNTNDIGKVSVVDVPITIKASESQFQEEAIELQINDAPFVNNSNGSSYHSEYVPTQEHEEDHSMEESLVGNYEINDEEFLHAIQNKTTFDKGLLKEF